MQKSKKVQTAFRLDSGLLNRLKRKARSKGMSLNAYVEQVLMRDAPEELEWPKVDIPQEIPSFVIQLQLDKPLEYTKEELNADPKLDYLVNKHLHGQY